MSKKKQAQSTSSVPPGLGYLTLVDQLIVNQQVDMIEMFTGWESKNRYVISNSVGQQAYYAVEENDFFTMNFFGSSRPFDMLIMDNNRVPVIRIHRPYQLEGLGCCGFVQQIEVTTGTGQLLGTVSEVWQCCGKKFRVADATGQTVFWLEGPVCTFDFIDTDFDVITANNNTKVGAITRKFPGLMRALYTHADIFGVRFPLDLQVQLKAVLLAATFLIDFMYYEKRETNMNQNTNCENGVGPTSVAVPFAAGMMASKQSEMHRHRSSDFRSTNQGFNNDAFRATRNGPPEPGINIGSNSPNGFGNFNF